MDRNSEYFRLERRQQLYTMRDVDCLLSKERKEQKRLAALSGDKSDMEVSDVEDGEIKEGSELAVTPMDTGTGEGTTSAIACGDMAVPNATSEFGTSTAKVQDVLITDVDEKKMTKIQQQCLRWFAMFSHRNNI